MVATGQLGEHVYVTAGITRPWPCRLSPPTIAIGGPAASAIPASALDPIATKMTLLRKPTNFVGLDPLQSAAVEKASPQSGRRPFAYTANFARTFLDDDHRKRTTFCGDLHALVAVGVVR